jgi:hypothetical protein
MALELAPAWSECQPPAILVLEWSNDGEATIPVLKAEP